MERENGGWVGDQLCCNTGDCAGRIAKVTAVQFYYIAVSFVASGLGF
jgi:hypothetical protein